ncbi:MAG: hypothetical protein NZ740_09760 [Kiritimatiellae bacterium]|nr:hypothetical protein [Kiritimatiellia bacterium]MDW8459379.1 hypothetical protein [Verrucomicrobiota bacterium]
MSPAPELTSPKDICPPAVYRLLQVGQVAYFTAVQLLLFAASPGMELDLAEQVWQSDRFAWVYGSQPPLYTWIVRCLWILTEGSLLPLYLLKAALLSLATGALLSAGRRMGFSAIQLAGVLAGVFWLPTVLWEAQRDLSHSVLATACAAWLLRCLTIEPRRPWAEAFRNGAWLAAGTLSKYNFLLFALAWWWAQRPAAARHGTFARLSHLAAVGIGAVLVLPHLAAATREESLLFESADKFEWGDGRWGTGLVDAAGAIAAMMVPVLGIWLAAGFPNPLSLARRTCAGRELRPLLGLLTAALALTLGLTALSGVSEVRERWLWPIFFFTPLFAGAALAHLPRSAAMRYIVAGFAVALVVGIGLPARVVWADAWGTHNRRNLPYPDLLRAIASAAEPADFIIADSVLVAGSARLAFPGARIFVYDRPHAGPPPRGSGLLIGRAEDRARLPFERWLDRMDLEPGPRTIVSAPLYHSAKKTAALWWSPVTIHTPLHFDDREDPRLQQGGVGS